MRHADAEPRFVPPYRTDLNPIEMAFSKFKTDLECRAILTVADFRGPCQSKLA